MYLCCIYSSLLFTCVLCLVTEYCISLAPSLTPAPTQNASPSLANQCRRTQLPTIPTSVAAIKAQYKEKMAKEWATLWRKSKRAKRQAAFDKRPPSNQTLKFFRGLPRRSCSLVTQLRTGFVGLNGYLHRINAVDSPNCPNCQVKETTTHFLLQCNRFNEQRHTLRLSMGKRNALTLRNLLGNPRFTFKLLRYVHATGRLSQYTDYVDHTAKEIHPRRPRCLTEELE